MVVFFMSFVYALTDYSLKIKHFLQCFWSDCMMSLYNIRPLCAFVRKY